MAIQSLPEVAQLTLTWLLKLLQWFENGPSPSSAFTFKADCCFCEGVPVTAEDI